MRCNRSILVFMAVVTLSVSSGGSAHAGVWGTVKSWLARRQGAENQARREKQRSQREEAFRQDRTAVRTPRMRERSEMLTPKESLTSRFSEMSTKLRRKSVERDEQRSLARVRRGQASIRGHVSRWTKRLVTVVAAGIRLPLRWAPRLAASFRQSHGRPPTYVLQPRLAAY